MTFSLKTKISTPKFRETIDFYEGVFGMTVVEAWDNPNDIGAILALPDGREEAYLEVYSADGQTHFDGFSLQFRVERVADFLATLSDDREFEGPTIRPWGSTYLYLRDPNNIQVIVYEGGL